MQNLHNYTLKIIVTCTRDERYGNKGEEERKVGDRGDLGDTIANYALKSNVHKFI